MKKISFVRSFLSGSAIAIGMLIVSVPSASAMSIVGALFTGFSGSADDSGMEKLKSALDKSFKGNANFHTKVFGHTQEEEAFKYINTFDDICCLFLIGHSFGADTVIELATDTLLPKKRNVDLTIQIDSIGIDDDKLPSNVKKGFNFYQESKGLKGEKKVQGAANDKFEDLFPNVPIEHTTIDDYSGLHDLIVKKVRATCVPEPLTILGSATALGFGAFFKRKLKPSKISEKETTKVS